MLNAPVTLIKGIGPAKSGILKSEAGIETVEDLLYYTPRRYLDRSNVKRIVDCFNEEEVTVSGRITSVKVIRNKKTFMQVDISDGTDALSGVFFGGLAFFGKIFVTGESVVFSGKITVFRRKQIVHPEFDFIDENQNQSLLNTGRIIPLYKSTMELKKHGFDSRGFRRVINNAITQYSGSISESLNNAILKKYNLLPMKDAVTGIHFPESPLHAESHGDASPSMKFSSCSIFSCLIKRR